LAIGAGATFFARSFDVNINENVEIMLAMQKHDGISIFEILQNCVIFNNGAHAHYTDKATKDDHQLHLKEGEPMIFGKNKDKGIMLDENYGLKVVKLGEDGVTEKDILVHDPHMDSPILHYELAKLKDPIAVGVIRSIEKPHYDVAVHEQIKQVQANAKIKSMDDLLNSGPTWEVE